MSTTVNTNTAVAIATLRGGQAWHCWRFHVCTCGPFVSMQHQTSKDNVIHQIYYRYDQGRFVQKMVAIVWGSPRGLLRSREHWFASYGVDHGLQTYRVPPYDSTSFAWHSNNLLVQLHESYVKSLGDLLGLQCSPHSCRSLCLPIPSNGTR